MKFRVRMEGEWDYIDTETASRMARWLGPPTDGIGDSLSRSWSRFFGCIDRWIGNRPHKNAGARLTLEFDTEAQTCRVVEVGE